jgi:hypothetical protein
MFLTVKESVVVNFQDKAFNHGHLLAYQLADVWRGPTDKRT